MNKRFLVSAAAVATLALAMGSNAVAGGFSIVDRPHDSRLGELVMDAGSDPDSVRIHFTGAQRVSIGVAGTLDVLDAQGSIWHYRPAAYQMVNGKQRIVTTGFHVTGQDSVQLRMKHVDASAPVFFGPVNSSHVRF